MLLYNKHTSQWLLSIGLLALSPLTLAAAPVAVDDTRTVSVNKDLTIDVLRNDYDPDGNSFTVSGTTAPTHGAIVVNPDGSIRYSPDADYIGNDAFTYSLQDSEATPSATSATVTINVADTQVTPFAVGPNDKSVANALDDLCRRLANTPDSDLKGGIRKTAERCNALLDLSVTNPDDIDLIVNKIAPEETVALMQNNADATGNHSRAVGQRTNQLIRGINRFSINGIAMTDKPQGGSAGEEEDLWSRLGIFATVLHEGAEKDSTNLESGFDYDANGLVIGADYKFTPDLVAGGAIGWTQNELEYSKDGGEVDSNTLNLISYMTYQYGNFNFSGQLAYGTSDYDTRRNIHYNEPTETLDLTALGNTGGEQIFLNTSVQYLWSREALTLYPYIQAAYLHSTIDGYTENEAEGWEVELGEQNLDQLTLSLGVQAQYSLSYNWGVFIPTAEFSLLSEAFADQAKVEGRFAFDTDPTNTFEIEADQEDQLYYQAGIGATAVFTGGLSTFLETRMTGAYGDLSAYQVLAGLRYEL